MSDDAPPLTGEDYLKSVTLGVRTPHNGPVHLADYDPLWPSRFDRLAGRIRETLGVGVLGLEHVGSTSVPGLAAKPVIDMVLAVESSADEPSYVPALERVGFVLRIREPDWFEHRLFKARDVPGNLHVFSAGCPEIGRMVIFRNWLRTHDEDRRRYESVKRELAARTWSDIQFYADAKSPVVREILGRAVDGGAIPARSPGSPA